MGFLFSLLTIWVAFLARSGLALIYDERCIGCIDVDVHFHVVAYDNGTIYYYNQTETVDSLVPMIHENMRIVNYELNETPFVFNWKNPDNIPVVNHTDWTLNAGDRVHLLNFWSFLGDRKSINVYLAHGLSFNTTLVGKGSLPSYDYNGVFMSYGILPPEGNGLTLVHEFGHWFGLLHTYENNVNLEIDDCHVSNPGDLVDDTPIQLKFDTETYTNETAWDSCPNQPGQDAFWNIMNRVCPGRDCFGDRAYLTEGQIQRMYLEWLFYRQHDDTCDDDQFLFGAEFPTQRATEEVIIFDEFGKEVYNLRTSYLDSTLLNSDPKNVSINICLHRNTSYFAVSYDASFLFVPDSVYSIDGQVVRSIARGVRRRAELFPLLTMERNASASQGNASLTYDAASSSSGGGCTNSTEALLEFSELDRVEEGVTIYDMTGEGRTLRRGSSRDNVRAQCVPRNGNYALLVCFYNAVSSNYTVFVGGIPRLSVNGPFHNPFAYIPRCSLTLLTPAMLSATTNVSSIQPSPSSHVPSLTPTALSTNPSGSALQSILPSLITTLPSVSPSVKLIKPFVPTAVSASPSTLTSNLPPANPPVEEVAPQPSTAPTTSASLVRKCLAVFPTLTAILHLYMQVV